MGFSRETLLRHPPDHVQEEDQEAWEEAVDRALGLFPCDDGPGCWACRFARWTVRLHGWKLWLMGHRDGGPWGGGGR